MEIHEDRLKKIVKFVTSKNVGADILVRSQGTDRCNRCKSIVLQDSSEEIQVSINECNIGASSW